MSLEHWAASAAKLMGSLKDRPSFAPFRGAFKSHLDDGRARGDVTDAHEEMLLDLMARLEGWLGEPAPKATEAWEEWKELYRRGLSEMPAPLLKATLARLPKVRIASSELKEITLQKQDRTLLTALLSAKVIRVSELVQVAKAAPEQFYHSVGLDVLVEQRASCPVTVWEPLARGEQRPPGMLPATAALILTSASKLSWESSEWLISFLARAREARGPILTAVLREERLSLHLAVTLGCYGLNPTSKARSTSDTDLIELLSDWVQVCLIAISEGHGTDRCAAFVLAELQVAAFAKAKTAISIGMRDLWKSISRATDAAMLRALRSADAGDFTAASRLPFVVQGDGLHRTYQEYIRMLPTGTSEATPAAIRIEQFKGRAVVLEGLIDAVSRHSEPGPLRDALEALLFNSGVQPMGAEGDSVIVDFNLHEAEGSGVLPGSPATVVTPGWRLGGQDGIVLRKAEVKADA